MTDRPMNSRRFRLADCLFRPAALVAIAICVIGITADIPFENPLANYSLLGMLTLCTVTIVAAVVLQFKHADAQHTARQGPCCQ